MSGPIEKKIAQFCILKGIQATPQRIKVTATMALKKYNEKEIMQAIDQLAYETEFFPDIAKISRFIETLKQSVESEAVELSNVIFSCISRFGPDRWEEVKEHVGELGWFIINQAGGWKYMCSITNDQVNTFKAQLRETCKAYLKTKPVSPEKVKIPYKREKMNMLNNFLSEYEQLEQ